MIEQQCEEKAATKATPVSPSDQSSTDRAAVTVIKGEVVNQKQPVFRPVAPSKTQLKLMDDAQVIRLAQQHGKVFSDYLVEAHSRFSNRGQVDRVIDGYNGWQDFCERGLEMHIRKAQRLIEEHLFPEHVAAAKALRREREAQAKEEKRLADKAAEKAKQPVAAVGSTEDPGDQAAEHPGAEAQPHLRSSTPGHDGCTDCAKDKERKQQAARKANEGKYAEEHGAKISDQERQQQEQNKEFFNPKECSRETADHVGWQKGRLNLQNGDYLLYLTLVRDFVKNEMDMLKAQSDAAKREPVGAEPRPARAVPEPLAASA